MFKTDNVKIPSLTSRNINIGDIQKDLELKQSILSAIVNSSDDAIISKTLDGIITSWNPAATRMFGYKETEAIGKHISLIIPPDRIQEETVIINSIRSGKKIDHFETVRLAKDGSRKYISLTVSPIKNSRGKIVGASKIARDISLKIEHEKQQQLYTEQLQELIRYKDEFMAMASHELKTPLTVILANLQILQLMMEKDPNVRFVNNMVKQSLKLSDLITRLLNVSKIQSGKLELNLSVFDMHTLIKEVTETVQQTTQTQHLIYKGYRGKSFVNADREKIEQVMVNLLGNAIKYMPQEGDINIKLQKKGAYLIISVEDRGVGIPKRDLENIFQRFYRVSGIPSSYSGSGIGLYISAEIIKMHHGKIWAESNMGSGSVFYFSIPINK
jgi:PAS domain S-box-containing protein